MDVSNGTGTNSGMEPFIKTSDAPLLFIRQCVAQRRVYWTYHVNMRMENRFISRRMVLDSVKSYEIIESYPADKYLPSYLVCATQGSIIFHVLFAVDLSDNNVRVITAYRPDKTKWSDDMKGRAKR